MLRPTLVNIKKLLKLTPAKLVITLKYNKDIGRSVFIPQQ